MDEAEKQIKIRFCVEDAGIGIVPDSDVEIFEHFPWRMPERRDSMADQVRVRQIAGYL
ncbi:hypothetical protein SAMN05216326_12348 [Nitrosomonas marina]|uniref:Uncharacterized protein n=1 Tax=Nitrosomonas marina TaxID=917 RepID=A0A1I0E055_9PROT|nr:hypothetical protein [Nitrosomonas marina]SET37523.1 hypothetical protein SAMN05216326_12348 [Nitrosomonas marina]